MSAFLQNAAREAAESSCAERSAAAAEDAEAVASRSSERPSVILNGKKSLDNFFAKKTILLFPHQLLPVQL